MLKENVIVLYIRKDHINISIIRRIGEARTLVPKYGFQLQEVDITHDYVKQKELHQTHNAANEYPHFQYCKDKENLYHIGNLDALRAFLLSPPPSILALHDSDKEEEEEGEQLTEKVNQRTPMEGEKEEESKEEEREPALGFISQSLQTVEGVVKYSTSWLTSWFYTPPSISPLPSNNNNNNTRLENNTENSHGDFENNNDNDNDNNAENKEEKKIEGGEEEKIKDFKVVQTNWYWRQQNRVLRFDLPALTLYRYDPLDLSIRAIHPLSLLRDVTCYTSQSFFQLSFAKSDSDPTLIYEYYTSSSSDFPLILSLLTSHSSVSPNVNP